MIRREVTFTEEQDKKVRARSEALGLRLRDYIRFMTCMEPSFLEKIDQMHRRICNAEENTEDHTLKDDLLVQ